MRPPQHLLRYIPHVLRGPTGSSTDRCMSFAIAITCAHRAQFGTAPHVFRGLMEVPPKAPAAAIACAHRAHVSAIVMRFVAP
eukprot:2538959-Pyramimonas_sp.AAC.1